LPLPPTLQTFFTTSSTQYKNIKSRNINIKSSMAKFLIHVKFNLQWFHLSL